ncbi:AMP-binding protein [Actinomadura decatromicini]|uniref:ATP-dependent acyl-CoA ligase n=1 Tax=Actinomadura decatromicini TaxID=2604572 RepID=A0A5D3F9J6_9ACTN|nr:AMP-binding protein [Actinomadura decatromicini]TYK44350.1 ATP-dependent acyl-CoA ligase [Actinomadura decatromicini]
MTAASLGGLLRERAATAPDRPLLRFGPVTLTVGQVADRAGRLANVLRAHGVERGDRVAVMTPNGAAFPVAWLAIAALGAVAVPVNAGYRSTDLAHVIGDSGARTALAGGADAATALLRAGVDQVGLLDPADAGPAPDVPAGPGTFDAGAEAAGAPAAFDPPDLGPDDVVNIQYTSGTTGFPKGCVLTHGYWLRTAEIVRGILGVTETDVDLTAQPFSYMDPQWNTVLCLDAGIPLVILPRFSASTFWKSVREHGVTFFYVLGTMPVFLLRQPPDPADREHDVRIVLCSGIVPELHASMEERWGVPWREAYGMTETGADLFVPADDTSSVGSGAIGVPVPGKEARIVDGELVIRGEPMMRGYWNDPAATAERIRDGWLYTGDLARQDDRGRFHLVGRRKDMIRRGGENVAAAEVEAVLVRHPAVRAAAVVAVPDELRGEEVKAFVQVGRATDPAELIAFVCERLAPFKVPRFLEYVDEFPMTPSERIAKHLLPPGRGAADDMRGE